MPAADSASPSEGTSPRRLAGDLDGSYLALGPLAGLIYGDPDWNRGFGGELTLVRVRERAPIGAAGIALGGLRYSEGEGGRVWLDIYAGTRRIAGAMTGLGAGITAEISPIAHARWGGHASLWVFAGVIPFVRIGVVQKSGLYVDFGVKVALPALRF